MTQEATQYAVASRKVGDMSLTIDNENPFQTPQNGYIYIKNMYAEFARLVRSGIESEFETDLENFLEMVDSGNVRKGAADIKRSAVYYIPEFATLREMKNLLGQTQVDLSRAESDFAHASKVHQFEVGARSKVRHLQKRVEQQKTTIEYLERRK